MIEDHANFLKVIKDLKSYMVKFEEDKTIKPKVYINNFMVKCLNQLFVIAIIYNEYIFF